MLPVKLTSRHPLSAFTRDNFLEPLRLAEALFEDFEGVGNRMSIDIREEPSRYVVEADMPGFNKDDLELTFEDGLLTVTAERKQETEESKSTYHVRERRVGRVTRALRLPRNVDAKSINANLRDGVLCITIDKAEDAKPHKIKVDAR